MAVTPEARFWSKVRVGPGCWEWTASVNPSGYGYFNAGTRPSLCVLAHRYAYEALVGPIADGLCVCHRCDNRICVRPNHLFLGSRAENNADRVAKGRSVAVSGEGHPRAKLTVQQVADIRRLFAAGANKSELARRFGVGHTTIRCLLAETTWRSVRHG